MKNQGHHYITESYQRLFANEKGQVTVLTPAGKVFTTNPENTFKEDHFNTVKLPDGGGTLAVEMTLGQIEGAFIAVIKDKVYKNQPLSEEDKIHVSMFVAAMFSRTKVQREHARRNFQNLKHSMEEWQKQFKTLSPERLAAIATMSKPSGDGPTLTIGDIEEGLKDFDSDQAASILPLVADITPVLLEMKWMLLEAPQGREFLCSDNPLCMCSPGREKEYGRRAIGAQAGLMDGDVEVSIPLSKRFALVFTWQKYGNEYELATPTMVDQINYRTARGADSLFASSAALLEGILATK